MIDVGRLDFDRALDGVSRSIEAVSMAERSSAKTIQKGAEQVSETILSASAIAAVDLLTSDEIDELRDLIAAGDPVSLARERMKDNAVAGMYSQLSDIGLIHCFRSLNGDPVFTAVDPKAAWAVGRRDLRDREAAERKAEAERRRKEDRSRQTFFIVVGWIMGLISSPVGDFIGEILKMCLQAIQRAG